MTQARTLAIVPTIVCILAAVAQLTKAQSSRCCEDYCYSRDPDRSQAKHFATKTAYELIHGSSSSRDHIVPS